MIFNSVESYEDILDKINQEIMTYSEYVKLHPEKVGVKSNLETLVNVRDMLIKEWRECLNDEKR